MTDLGKCVFDWPFSLRTLGEHFQRIQKAAGLPGDYGFHNLKKSCGTLNASRMSPAELNKVMRHSSMQTTMKH